MRILVCLVPLILVAAAPADQAPPSKSSACPGAVLSEAKRNTPLRAHPLVREPGAKQEIAVLRLDSNHCARPIVVRDNVGGRSN